MRAGILGFKAMFALLLLAAAPTAASPWAEVGDNQLRSDIELLEAAGVVSTVTIQWPLPWQSLMNELSRAPLAGQSAGVQAACIAC
jgi:hypothetical protein